jgi:hypothetical protein
MVVSIMPGRADDFPYSLAGIGGGVSRTCTSVCNNNFEQKEYKPDSLQVLAGFPMSIGAQRLSQWIFKATPFVGVVR